MLDRSHEMLVAHSLTTQETLLGDPTEHCSEFSVYLQQIFQTSLLFRAFLLKRHTFLFYHRGSFAKREAHFLSIQFRLGQIEFRLGQMSS